MKKRILCTGLLAFGLGSIHAQGPRIGLGADLLGPVGLASAHLTLDVSDRVQLTAGGGFVGAFGGAKFYFSERKKTRFYTGIHYTRFVRYYDFDIFSGFYSGLAYGVYIPLGVEIESSTHFSTSFELAYRSLDTQLEPYSPVYPCVKFTYKFGRFISE
jgi:hypothetical protein